MRKIVTALSFLLIYLGLSAQPEQKVLSQVFAVQQQILYTASYKLLRIDSLVTGQVRKLTGETKIQVAPKDSLYGYWFWTKRDDINVESIYDGSSGLEVNNDTKQFEHYTDQFSLGQLPNHYGQVIYRELVKLDTAGSTGFELTEDAKFYYLTMHLPDITKYDVTNRYKKFSIDKSLLLPVRMKNHQETAGKVQDLYYEVTDLHLNDPKLAYNFSGERIPVGYKPVVHAPAASTLSLLNKPAPGFELYSLGGENVMLESLKGKTVLLDFGEIWCGPCLASMPKIQELYAKYRSKGLVVYGVSFERNQLDAYERMLKKLTITFPVFSGNASMRKAYQVEGIPRYVIIDRQGIISFVATGYSDVLEEEVRKCLDK